MRIDAHSLAVQAGGRPLLSGVSLSLQPGAFTGVIGPNGAGKSTLLRVLAGIAPPAAGTVTYDGVPLARLGRRRLARAVAYLPQDGPVHWPLTAEAVVMLGRLPHRGLLGGITQADRTAVDRALTVTDARHLRHRITGTLSGGERMRVLLARALATEPALLLADEPVSALDPRHQLAAMALLRASARGGTGVVAVLHDLTLAARFCDRLILLARGAVRADGPPAAVLTDPLLAGAYGITVHRGAVDGTPYLLPWSTLPSSEQDAVP